MDENTEVEGGTKWTDRHFLKYGKLTVLELEIQERGNFVQQIRARSPFLNLNSLSPNQIDNDNQN